MKRYLWALVASILSISLNAVEIDQKHRIKNRPPGYCAWCCLETLGRHHKVEALYDLSAKRDADKPLLVIHNGQFKTLPLAGAYVITIIHKLNDLNVKYSLQPEGVFDRRIVERASKEGCVVDVKAGSLCKEAHAIVLTHYDDDKIEYIDPNKPEVIFHVKRVWFDENWTGRAVILEK